MKRQELQAEVENVLLHTVLMSPCIQCGGDEFRVRHVSRAMAYYLCELVKTYKYNEGMDFEKAKKHADKKTSRFFADLATDELEKLLGSPIGDLPTEEARETPETDPEAPARPSQEPKSRTETQDKGPSREAAEQETSRQPLQEETGRSNGPEPHGPARESSPPRPSDPSEEALPHQESADP